MGKYKDAVALYNQLPDDHPMKQKYGSELSRKEFRNEGRNVTAFGMELMQSKFDEQWGFLKDKDKTSKKFFQKVEKLLANTPEYVIPDAVGNLIGVLENYATEVRDIYNQGATDIQKTIEDNIDQAISAYVSNADKAIQEIKESGEASVNQYQEALGQAYDSAQNILTLAQQNKTDILQEIESGTASMQEQIQKIESAVAGTVPELRGLYEETAKGIMEQYREGSTTMFDIYDKLARQDMPGYDLYRQRAEAKTAGDIEKLKELVAGKPGGLEAVAKLMSERDVNLQDLAVQNALYKTEQQEDLASAAVNRAELMARGYTTAVDVEGLGKERLLGYETGAAKDIAAMQRDITGMRTEGISEANRGVLNAEQLAAALKIGAHEALGAQIERTGTTLGQTYLDVARGESGVLLDALNMRARASEVATGMKATGATTAAAYETTAGGLGAEYADREWQYNQMFPWEKQYEYYTGRGQQTDPTDYMMQLYGDEAGVSLAQLQGLYDKQVANKQMWGNIIGSVIGLAGEGAKLFATQGTGG